MQFGNVARYTYDVYKMAIALALEKSDVGIMAVCSKRFAAITGGNIAYYERVVRELAHSKLTLIVPLVVLGVEPDSWTIGEYDGEEAAPNVNAKIIKAAKKDQAARHTAIGLAETRSAGVPKPRAN